MGLLISLLRLLVTGYDRHGRKYRWFIASRIVVEETMASAIREEIGLSKETIALEDCVRRGTTQAAP